ALMRGAAQAAFRDQARDQPRGGDVEGVVARRAAGCGDLDGDDLALCGASTQGEYLIRAALLDWNVAARGQRPVAGRVRAGEMKRYAVVDGGQRLQVGADLVRHVAVAGDAVGADDTQIDEPPLHEMAAGIVDDDRVRYAMRAELEGGQRCALIARPRLVHP